MDYRTTPQILGSGRVTLSDTEILAMLREYNAGRPALHRTRWLPLSEFRFSRLPLPASAHHCNLLAPVL
jgi:hypothetical protein